MQPVIDFIWSLGGWNWLFAAMILFGLETVVPGVHFMWFGAAAVLVGGLALFVDIPWQYQLVIFAGLSIASVFALRGYVGNNDFVTDQPNLNERGAAYVGRTVVVADAIHNGRGRVRLGDTLWLAEGPNTPAGTEVRVVAVKGTALVVEPL